MCAFFASRKGSDTLKNKLFKLKSAEEKRRRLAAVLRNISGGALDDAMIGRILPIVSIHEQYAVSAFSSNRMFQEAVARSQTGDALLTVVVSRAGRKQAAAVIAPLKQAGSKTCQRAIYVYTPNLFHRRGARQWARASKNG